MCDLIAYSPLCDTDRAVAIAFYDAVVKFAEARVGCGGKCAVVGSGCSGDCGAKGAVVFEWKKKGVPSLLVGSSDANDTSEVCGRREFRCIGSARESRSCDSRKEVARDEAVQIGGSSGGGDCIAGSGKVGKNLERNRLNRERQKFRKLRKQTVAGKRPGSVGASVLVQESWRQASGDDGMRQAKEAVVSGSSRGYFSELSVDVQRKLKESRAKMLIAENEKKEMHARSCLARNVGPEALVRELVRVSALAVQVKKQTADMKIGGWAETVSEFVTKSVAESAPSSVPSLEDVGYGESSLKSSCGYDKAAELARGVRIVEYKKKKNELSEYWEAQDVVVADQDKREIAALEFEYRDVLRTSAELVEIEKKIERRAFASDVCIALVGKGVSPLKLQEVMVDFDLLADEEVVC